MVRLPRSVVVGKLRKHRQARHTSANAPFVNAPNGSLATRGYDDSEKYQERSLVEKAAIMGERRADADVTIDNGPRLRQPRPP